MLLYQVGIEVKLRFAAARQNSQLSLVHWLLVAVARLFAGGAGAVGSMVQRRCYTTESGWAGESGGEKWPFPHHLQSGAPHHHTGGHH